MSTKEFITKIRNLILDETSFTTVFSPELPPTGTNICAVSILAGLTENSLVEYEYSTVTFRVLIRGNENDLDTRELCDEVFKALHLLQNISLDNGKIINIIGSTPIFVRKDENKNCIYNITFESNIQ